MIYTTIQEHQRESQVGSGEILTRPNESKSFILSPTLNLYCNRKTKEKGYVVEFRFGKIP